jgi:hypothetical protein
MALMEVPLVAETIQMPDGLEWLDKRVDLEDDVVFHPYEPPSADRGRSDAAARRPAGAYVPTRLFQGDHQEDEVYPSPDKEWNWPRDDTYDGRTGMSVEIYVSSPEPSRGAQARAPTECAPKIHLTVPGDGPPRTPLQQVHRTPPRAFTSVKQKVHFELEKCREDEKENYPPSLGSAFCTPPRVPAHGAILVGANAVYSRLNFY